MLLRVVLMNVDMMKCGLLQTEYIDHGPMKDVIGLCKELVKTPALLLICLQDVGKNWCQEALKAPETTKCRFMSHNALLVGEDASMFGGPVYLDKLQETGISLLHSIFPFSHFWCPEMVPGGFSVMILYLQPSKGHMNACTYSLL